MARVGSGREEVQSATPALVPRHWLSFSIHLAGASGGIGSCWHPISAALGIGLIATSIDRPIKCNHFIY
ncbi:unnamed protein product [Prunus armeniaca]|uniref:Uncharacterized protein n=1 Tax=Prunus armeniaca TaxID=36596 RepID=A0A6J5X539_PRUAR|nr:unnamed protein product [Prunus armeniaca]